MIGLPTTTSPIAWAAITVLAIAVTLMLAALTALAESRDSTPRIAIGAVALLVDACVNTALAIRWRDLFWNDTWVSVFGLLVVVLALALLAALAAFNVWRYDDLDLTSLAIAAGGVLSFLGTLLWSVGQIIDTVDRSLQPLGLASAILLAGLFSAYVLHESR